MRLSSSRQREAAKAFAQAWKDRGDEKQDTQSFWTDLLSSVYGIESPARFIQFEKRVKFGGTTKFIDGYIPATKVLIEQKGARIDLSRKEEQSDGAPLTPYEQGKRYADWLPASERPRWIVVCNFTTFEIHDLEKPNDEPICIALSDLPKAYGSLSFLTDLNEHARKAELDLSVKAAGLIAKLYNALLPLYGEGRQDDPAVLKSLNKLCVRLVFCLYAEDAGLFAQKDLFAHFLESYRPENAGDALEKLFAVLNTPKDRRKPSLDPKYAAFSYVNGGLFAHDEDDEIPPFDQKAYGILLHECSEQFNWSEISPTIFGAMFESTLNPETRRKGGMHYTSIENIHKVIDPLFLDGLREELCKIKQEIGIRSGKAESGSGVRTIITKKYAGMLRAYQDKLAGLKFLDPACGSGNFLTETYICLRRLENEVLNLLGGGTLDLFTGQQELSPVKVSISQFHGIEINDFAVSVAKTALWIAESQMLDETARIVGHHIDFLPLKTYTSIVEGNALRLDWNSVLP
ncbi:MAG: methylase, partial [Aeromonadales bacterium]|nr:methylase [Aeromonadales bacterium]MDY2890052.1 type IIL restriction-modification enzyme MmeI [Succinivibrio sp.]